MNAQDEMYRVFNMGLGMVAVCNESKLPQIQELLPDSTVVGRIIKREGDTQVFLSGD